MGLRCGRPPASPPGSGGPPSAGPSRPSPGSGLSGEASGPAAAGGAGERGAGCDDGAAGCDDGAAGCAACSTMDGLQQSGTCRPPPPPQGRTLHRRILVDALQLQRRRQRLVVQEAKLLAVLPPLEAHVRLRGGSRGGAATRWRRRRRDACQARRAAGSAGRFYCAVMFTTRQAPAPLCAQHTRGALWWCRRACRRQRRRGRRPGRPAAPSGPAGGEAGGAAIQSERRAARGRGRGAPSCLTLNRSGVEPGWCTDRHWPILAAVAGPSGGRHQAAGSCWLRVGVCASRSRSSVPGSLEDSALLVGSVFPTESQCSSAWGAPCCALEGAPCRQPCSPRHSRIDRRPAGPHQPAGRQGLGANEFCAGDRAPCRAGSRSPAHRAAA